MVITAQELCQLLGGELEGNPDISVDRPGKIEEAGPGSLSFLANPKYEQFVYETKASVLLVPKDFVPQKPIDATLIRVADVYQSLGTLLNSMNSEEQLDEGISPMANVHESAKVGNDVRIGAFSVVSRGAVIGTGTMIYPQVYIGQDVIIGDNVRIFPGTRIIWFT